jgi:hypothetical protein
MAMTEQVPAMETAYLRFTPMFFRALAKLARQGFVVSPNDSLDLIHDFFATEWDRLNVNYDPAKGSFDAYAWVAFVRFARPRIVRLRRFQSCLIPAEGLDRIVDPATESQVDPTFYLAVEEIRHAISQLSMPERSILRGYIESSAPSERLLAKTFNLSRYGLREALVNALGHVLVLLDNPGHVPERDWTVALALWRDRRTVEEAASFLQMTNHQVKQANRRNVRLLEETLQNYRSRLPKRRTMTRQRDRIQPERLIADVLVSDGDRQLLEELRNNVDEVLSAIETSDSFGLTDSELTKLNPLWVAEVYEALSGRELDAIEDSSITEALFHATATDEASIGAAFSEVLLADLPERLQSIAPWIPSRSRLLPEEILELREEPSVEPGMRFSEELLEFGVTPMTVFYAIDSIWSLAERLIRYGYLDKRTVVILSDDRIMTKRSATETPEEKLLKSIFGEDTTPPPAPKENKRLTIETVIDEIGKVANCDAAVSRGLYMWSLRAAQYKPLLFNRFHATPIRDGVELTYTGDDYEDLFFRWQSAYNAESSEESHEEPSAAVANQE